MPGKMFNSIGLGHPSTPARGSRSITSTPTRGSRSTTTTPTSVPAGIFIPNSRNSSLPPAQRTPPYVRAKLSEAQTTRTEMTSPMKPSDIIRSEQLRASRIRTSSLTSPFNKISLGDISEERAERYSSRFQLETLRDRSKSPTRVGQRNLTTPAFMTTAPTPTTAGFPSPGGGRVKDEIFLTPLPRRSRSPARHRTSSESEYAPRYPSSGASSTPSSGYSSRSTSGSGSDYKYAFKPELVSEYEGPKRPRCRDTDPHPEHPGYTYKEWLDKERDDKKEARKNHEGWLQAPHPDHPGYTNLEWKLHSDRTATEMAKNFGKPKSKGRK